MAEVRYIGNSTTPVYPVFGDVEFECVPGEVYDLPDELVHGVPADEERDLPALAGLLEQGHDAHGEPIDPQWELVGAKPKRKTKTKTDTAQDPAGDTADDPKE